MFNHAINWPSVGRTIFWTLLVALVAGFFWSAGCYLFGRIAA